MHAAQDLAGGWAALPRPHRQSSGARPARRPHAAGRGKDRPSRPDSLSLHRSRPELEGSGKAARVPEGVQRREGTHGRSHLLARCPVTRASLASGTRAPRPRDSSARRTAASRWEPFSSINDDPRYPEWMGTVQDGTPDGPKLHSIIVDPRDPAHLYFGMSGGGVHESVDGGRTWKVLVQGMEVVEGFDASTPTFHDPHCVRLCPSNPDRLYQQNHCGIYRLDRPSTEWVRDRQEHAEEGRRHRLSAWWCIRAMRTRSGCSRWTARPSGRAPARTAALRLRHAQWRKELAAPRFRLTEGPGVVDGETAGDDGGCAGSRRSLLRHHERRTVDEPRRRRPLDVHRAASSGDLCGRSRRAGC